MGRKPLDPSERTPIKNINIRFPEEDANKLSDIADNLGISISALVRLIVTSKLKKLNSENNITDLFD